MDRKRGEENGECTINEQTGHGYFANLADYSMETRKTLQNTTCAELITNEEISVKRYRENDEGW